MIRPAAFLLLLPLVAAAARAQNDSGLKGHDSNAPIDITSDSIEVQDRANRAIWVGRVHAIQGDMTMDAQRMTVAYRKAATPGGDPEIQRIDASGGVIVVSPTEKAQGSFGIYDLDRRLITLIGGVTLTRDTNVLHGARLVINLDTGRSTMDGSAVGGGAGAVTNGSGRVSGHFSVPKRAAATPATPGNAPTGGATPPK